MKLRDVERGEVVELRLDFGAVLDRVAHRDEDVLDALAQKRYRVQVAAARTTTGQRHVNALALSLQEADANLESSLRCVKALNDVIVKSLN